MFQEGSDLLSVVVPIYKKSRIIRRNLKEIISDLKTLKMPFEVIAVVDGYDKDKSLAEARKVKSKYLRVFGYKINHGKGYAFNYGVSKSRGNLIGLLDAGGDIKANGFSMLLEHFTWYGADIIVGSKRHPVSHVKYPRHRRVMSWGYQTLVRILFGLKVTDTQVGIKLYKRGVLENVLPRLLVKKFAFDIEILAVAHALGYKRIFEAPVAINFPKNTSITSRSALRIITGMLLDTLAVYYRLKILRYYHSNKNKELVTEKVI